MADAFGGFGTGAGPEGTALKTGTTKPGSASPSPAPAPTTTTSPGGGIAVPAWGIPVTRNMDLEIRGRVIDAAFTLPLSIEWVLMLDDGRLVSNTRTLAASNADVSPRVVLDLDDGYLLSVGITVGPNATANVYARVRAALLLPGVSARPATVLLDGFVQGNHAVCWPYSNEPAIPAPGQPWTFTGANPAAGVEASFVVPEGVWLRPTVITGTLVTSAAAASRFAAIAIGEAGGATFEASDRPVTQLLSTTTEYVWRAGLATDGAGTVNPIIGMHPADLWISPNSSIITDTLNLQAGDNWGPLTIVGYAVPDNEWDLTD